jgi:phage baseplate assembly protein W
LAASKVIDFLSVGERDTAYRRRTTVTQPQVPIGIKTPLEKGQEVDGLFVMHKNLEDTVSDNLRNLLLTNHGERIFRYDYGANLRELAFELGTEEGDTEAILRIREAVSKYLPYVNLQTFESSQTASTYTDPAKVIVRVTYSVPGVSQKQRMIEVILSAVN